MIPWGFAYDNLSYRRYSSADLSNVSHPEEYQLGNTLRLKDSPSRWENETPFEEFLLTMQRVCQ